VLEVTREVVGERGHLGGFGGERSGDGGMATLGHIGEFRLLTRGIQPTLAGKSEDEGSGLYICKCEDELLCV
jgi:hypothetical protein